MGTHLKRLQKQEVVTWESNICIVCSSGWVTSYILLAQICAPRQGKGWEKVRRRALNNVRFILVAGCASFVWRKRSKTNAITLYTNLFHPFTFHCYLEEYIKKKKNSPGAKFNSFFVTNGLGWCQLCWWHRLSLLHTDCIVERFLVFARIAFLCSS